METIEYSGTNNAVNWCGFCLTQNDEYIRFIQNDVAERLYDHLGQEDFNNHLRGLAATGFALDNLDAILAAEVPEQRAWAIGEAFAEAWLSKQWGVIWPWSMERDKRTPKASLPGADLIGFVTVENETRLLIGEVKTSSDKNTPPNVMNGRTGIIHQLEDIASNLSLIAQLLKWLQPRCKNTSYEPHFNAAVTLMLTKGNQNIAIFGVLIRDTTPSAQDLTERAKRLAQTVQIPTHCHLQALYLPHTIAGLPTLVANGATP
jgi:hypothetical protein